MKKLLLLTLTLTLVSAVNSYAQKDMERLDTHQEIICYAAEKSAGTRVFQRLTSPYGRSPYSANLTAGTQQTGATIEVTYNGFSEDAQLAFQKAIDIWSELISSDVVIHVNATWQQLDEGTLGSAIWNTAYRNFDGAKEADVWYPVALAEKMAGKDLNSPDDADIVANFNKDAPWYLGTDGNTSVGEFDLVSVVLHELGHGLGFIDSFDYNEDNSMGSVGLQNFSFIFDLSVENSAGDNLNDFTNNSIELGTALTSGSVFFNSPTAVAANNVRPRLYAPTTWSPGSSIAHLNESTYPSGNPNSLMTPQIAPNEVIHDPGQVTLDMFGDMGWEYTYVEHTNRANTEDIQADSYTITASIKSDVGYKPESVKLFYSTDGFNSNSNEIVMTATGNADEFTAEVPSTKTAGQTYTYYFQVEDTKNREFTRPSLLLPDRYFSFSTNLDQTAPVITHTAPNFVRTSDQTVNIQAVISDFLPVNAQLEYFINSGAPQTIDFTLTDYEESLYTAAIDFSGVTLNDGDVLSYKISATDISSNTNSSIFPTTGYTEVNVIATADPVPFYFNDFNDIDASNADFFTSNNFRVKEETGFDDGALHSDHPYADGTGTNNQSNYTIELKVPIILRSNEAKISFDEVVLVEPGEANSEFGDTGFYDYVIVEASKDGGTSWLPLGGGYDSRSQPAWVNTYTGSLDTDNNSTAVGNQSLYRSREINILDNEEFLAGDEVLVRFRLFADEAAHGWGWAIDNLNIQLDNEAPTIKHNHFNYLTSLEDITISAEVTDNFDVDSVGVLLMVNDMEQGRIQMANIAGSTYQTLVNVSGLSTGDVIKYRLAAFDTKQPEANVKYLPSETGFFEVPIIEFGAAQDSYSNDFNAATTDFVGNFFSVETATGFSDGAINSVHPYPLPFGLNSRSTFTYTLKTPITISSSKPYMTFKEVVLIDSSSDYVAVEGSKDGGDTWFEITSYDTNDEPNLWGPVYQANGVGGPSLFKTRIIKLTDASQISAGDEVLLRFRMERTSIREGWGWLIDDLEIQTEVIAGLEDEEQIKFVNVYPNPVRNGQLSIQVTNPNARSVDYSIVSLNGQSRLAGQGLELDNDRKASIDVSSLPSGLFVLKVIQGETAKVYKVMKLD